MTAKISFRWKFTFFLTIVVMVSAGVSHLWGARKLSANALVEQQRVLASSLDASAYALDRTLERIVPELTKLASTFHGSSRAETDANQLVDPDLIKGLVSLQEFELSPDQLKSRMLFRNQTLMDQWEMTGEEYDRQAESLKSITSPTKTITLLTRKVLLPPQAPTPEIASFVLLIPIGSETNHDTTETNSDLKKSYLVAQLVQSSFRELWTRGTNANTYILDASGEIVLHPSVTKTLELLNSTSPHPLAPFASQSLGDSPRTTVLEGTPHLWLGRKIRGTTLTLFSAIPTTPTAHPAHSLKGSLFLILISTLGIGVLSGIFATGSLSRNFRRVQRMADQIANRSLRDIPKIRGPKEVALLANTLLKIEQKSDENLQKELNHVRQIESANTVQFLERTLFQTLDISTQDFDCLSESKSGAKFGGNFVHSVQHGDLLFIAVADTCGTRQEKIVLTSAIKTYLLSLTPHELSDTRHNHLEKLNHIIHVLGRGSLTSGMCLALIHARTGQFYLSSAGTPPPLVASPVGKSPGAKDTVSPICCRGNYLGMDADSQYPVVSGVLPAGSTLLLYTKSLVEVRNTKGAEMGNRGIYRTLKSRSFDSVANIRRDLISSIETHLRGTSADEEITFALFQWQPSVLISDGKRSPTAEVRRGTLGRENRRLVHTSTVSSTHDAALKGSGSTNDLPIPEETWDDFALIEKNEEIKPNLEEFDENASVTYTKRVA